MLYESFLLLGVLAGGFLAPHILIGMMLQQVLPGWFLAAHFITVWSIYFIWYWGHGGQTLAMQTWKLKLVARNGNRPSSRQIWLRYLLAWPSLLICGMGIVSALLDEDRQFLHDRLAGTKIARD